MAAAPVRLERAAARARLLALPPSLAEALGAPLSSNEMLPSDRTCARRHAQPVRSRMVVQSHMVGEPDGRMVG
eukprot:6195672-Pleurochrysis_carterae.AAC.1